MLLRRGPTRLRPLLIAATLVAATSSAFAAPITDPNASLLAGLLNVALGGETSPETFGFPSIEDECNAGPLLGMGFGPRTVCQTPETFLFWDQSHPSAAADRRLGAEFAAAVQDSPVPEPSTMALAGLAVAALAVWRRRAA